MGNEVSTPNGGVIPGEMADDTSQQKSIDSSTNAPAPQFYRSRASNSARPASSNTNNKSDGGSLAIKRKVLVGAAMGMEDTASQPQRASSSLSPEVGIVASARSFPPDRKSDAAPSPASRNVRRTSDGASSPTRGSHGGAAGSTSELYSISSVIIDDKASTKSRGSETSKEPTSATPLTGTMVSVLTAKKNSPVTSMNAAQERRVRHGEPVRRSSDSSFGADTGSAMEFRPSDVDAFFDPHGSSSSNNKDQSPSRRTTLVYGQSGLAPSSQGAGHSRSTVHQKTPVVSSSSSSSAAAAAAAKSKERKTAVPPKLTAATVCDGRKDKKGLRRKSSSGFSRSGSFSSQESSSSLGLQPHGSAIVSSSSIQVKPARRTGGTTVTGGGGGSSDTTRASPRRTVVPATSAITAPGKPSRTLSKVGVGSQFDGRNASHGAGGGLGGSPAMGSMFGSKNGVGGDDQGGFYGVAKNVTSLYAGLLDDSDGSQVSSTHSRGGTPKMGSMIVDPHATTSLYQSEQPLLVNTSAGRRNSSSKDSDLAHNTNSSSNGSFFAMRDLGYPSSSSGPASQSNSRVNRGSGNGVTAPGHTPRSPMTASKGTSTSGSGGGGGSDENGASRSLATQARLDHIPASPKKSASTGGGTTPATTSVKTRRSPRGANLAGSSGDILSHHRTTSPDRSRLSPRAPAAENRAGGSQRGSNATMGPYDLMSLSDIGSGSDRPPRRTVSNASSRVSSRASHPSLTESVASSAASSRSSSISSTVSRRDVNGLQRRAAAQSSRSPGTSVSGNFQGRYMNAGSRKRSLGASDEVLQAPFGDVNDATTHSGTPRETSTNGIRGPTGSGRRRRGTLTTFADDAAGGGHDPYNNFFSRVGSQNGMSTDGTNGKADTEDDNISNELRQAHANILVQLSNNTSNASSSSQNGQGAGGPPRVARPPTTTFKPLTISADKFKTFQQSYGLSDPT